MATPMALLLLEPYIAVFSFLGDGAISDSNTRLRGDLLVAVFLSQILLLLDYSLSSLAFYFSISLVKNTSSSFGGLNGELPSSRSESISFSLGL
jgi:hypothetical protein